MRQDDEKRKVSGSVLFYCLMRCSISDFLLETSKKPAYLVISSELWVSCWKSNYYEKIKINLRMNPTFALTLDWTGNMMWNSTLEMDLKDFVFVELKCKVSGEINFVYISDFWSMILCFLLIYNARSLGTAGQCFSCLHDEG